MTPQPNQYCADSISKLRYQHEMTKLESGIFLALFLYSERKGWHVIKFHLGYFARLRQEGHMTKDNFVKTLNEKGLASSVLIGNSYHQLYLKNVNLFSVSLIMRRC